MRLLLDSHAFLWFVLREGEPVFRLSGLRFVEH